MQNRRVLLYGLFLVQLLFIVGSWLNLNAQTLNGHIGSTLIALGGLSGLLAGFFFLYQMIIISGANFFEKYFGLDRLSRIHHYHGLLGYFFLIAHVLLIVTGYSRFSERAFLDELFNLRDSLPHVGLAILAVIILDIVIITSIVIVRKRLKYELWYFVHLSVYVAVLLALFHQITNGQTLLQSDILKAYWLALYAAAFGTVIWRRWGLPLYNERRHAFRVERIQQENRNVTSVFIKGNNLNKFSYQAGQFNLWRFWQKGFRATHHPFTISSSPNDDFLQISAKAIGDMTSKMNQIKPGTKVFVGGPYGIFGRTLSKKKRLFIAGGIGITPIRSMLRANTKKGDILIYGAQTKDDLIFKEEFDSTPNLRTIYVLSEEKADKYYHGHVDESILKQIGDISEREVWLCGPPPMLKSVRKKLTALGVPKKYIHYEIFRLS